MSNFFIRSLKKNFNIKKKLDFLINTLIIINELMRIVSCETSHSPF